ncbi:sterol 26-hydroxylase, mitochondrial-like isoform X2 [Pleurodeles waltl]|uniref:sterol 26-hydroxylase, mitochondrial-like isoform X2 n=1 Tax=Pleurodeles waltl TaxID=8319 RepID=UPI00370994FF
MSGQKQIVQRKIYGPMWRAGLRLDRNVGLASPESIEAVLRQDGKLPMMSEMDSLKEYRELRSLAKGPLTSDGEQWYKIRAALNKRMLLAQEVVVHTESINEVVSDLITRIRCTREDSPTGTTVGNVTDLLYRLALESLCSIFFNIRIGSLEKEVSPETVRFINSIGQVLKNAQYVDFLPKWTRGILPYWKRFLEGSDIIEAYAKKLISKKMEEIQAQVNSGKELEGNYLTHLLTDSKMTIQEAYGILTELLQAGVDTTSNTLAWTLYHLARDLELQNTLFKEVISVVPAGQIPTLGDFTKMPLLKAVIKETLRLYPVVPLNARIALEKDIVIGDYHFPKKTAFLLCQFALTRDETNFPEPDRFLPSRWLRDAALKPHPFSSIPFGFGVRACVGRRISEMEMYLTLSRLVQTFEMIPASDLGEVKAVNEGILIPDKPISLDFLDRDR